MSGINKLTDTKIKKTQPSDKIIQLGDGDRLWLVVYPSGKRSGGSNGKAITNRINSPLAIILAFH